MDEDPCPGGQGLRRRRRDLLHTHGGRELTTQQKNVNRAHSRLRAPVERAFARLKDWRIFRRARISPNRLTSMVKAVLTLERQR